MSSDPDLGDDAGEWESLECPLGLDVIAEAVMRRADVAVFAILAIAAVLLVAW